MASVDKRAEKPKMIELRHLQICVYILSPLFASCLCNKKTAI